MIDIIDRFKGEQRSCYPIKNCGGVLGGEAFLMRTGDVNILIDSGYGFSAERAVEKIESELNGQSLDYILLTHSHYDHAMGSAYISRAFPQAKIVASEYCSAILNKPTARQAIRNMDVSAAQAYKMPEAEDLTELLHVDIAVKDGDVLKLGSHDVRVIALPGHTKCCVGYYFCNEQFLISCETIGIYVGGMEAMPGCLVGYKMTLDSIDRVLELPMKEMLISHSGMLYGDVIKSFLRSARKSTVDGKELVVNAWKNGTAPEQIGKLFRDAYYSENVARYYPEPAFRANLAAQIPMFIRECGEEG